MSLTTIIGKKLGQSQGFLENGKRTPLSKIFVGGNVVSQIKTTEKEGYNSIQLGFGENKKPTKPIAGHIKKAGIKNTPRFFREVKVEKVDDYELGAPVVVAEILEAGDIVDVSGTSKGKGFAGVVKRHHFKGGPKTHGQSDRHRAPGSIGQSTTPGRVYKGKRMAGRMGDESVTVKNLEVIEVLEDGTILVKGLVPGSIGSIITVTRRGKNKKHAGLYKESVKEEVIDEKKVEEIGESIEEQEEARVEAEAAVSVESSSEPKEEAVEATAETEMPVEEVQEDKDSEDESSKAKETK